MVRLGEGGLGPEDIAQHGLSLYIAISRDPKRFGAGGPEGSRELDLLARFRDLSKLMRDVGHDSSLRVFHLQGRLSFRVLLLLDLLSLPPPIEHVPGRLDADAAHAVRK